VLRQLNKHKHWWPTTSELRGRWNCRTGKWRRTDPDSFSPGPVIFPTLLFDPSFSSRDFSIVPKPPVRLVDSVIKSSLSRTAFFDLLTHLVGCRWPRPDLTLFTYDRQLAICQWWANPKWRSDLIRDWITTIRLLDMTTRRPICVHSTWLGLNLKSVAIRSEIVTNRRARLNTKTVEVLLFRMPNELFCNAFTMCISVETWFHDVVMTLLLLAVFNWLLGVRNIWDFIFSRPMLWNLETK